jgi:hypothetical protein
VSCSFQFRITLTDVRLPADIVRVDAASQMPPLATVIRDRDAVAALEQWIVRTLTDAGAVE